MNGCSGWLAGVAGVIAVIVILCKTGHLELVLGIGIGIGIFVWAGTKLG